MQLLHSARLAPGDRCAEPLSWWREQLEKQRESCSQLLPLEHRGPPTSSGGTLSRTEECRCGFQTPSLLQQKFWEAAAAKCEAAAYLLSKSKVVLIRPSSKLMEL